MKTLIRISGYVSVLLLLHGYAYAQLPTMSSIEKAKETSLWFAGSGNAAGMTVDQTIHTNELTASYDHSSGKFKRLQTGDTESEISFKTQGGGKIGGTYLWGNFGYGRRDKKGTQWNTNMVNPHRDLPFYMADPKSSDWEVDVYAMNMKLSFPFLFGDKLAFGISVDYLAELGGKLVYPTGAPDFHSFDVRPGLVYRLSPSIFVGLSGQYLNMSERSSHSTDMIPEEVRLMRGLGFSSFGIIDTWNIMNSFSLKELWGGELQLGAKNEDAHLLLAAGYRNSVDEAFTRSRNVLDQSSFFAEHVGALLCRQLYMNLSATLNVEGNIHLIKAGVNNAYRRGVEGTEVMETKDPERSALGTYVMKDQSVRSTYDHWDVQASYDYFKGKSDDDYLWRAGAFIRYDSDKDDYLSPIGRQHWSRLDIGLNLKYNVTLNSESFMLIGVNALNHSNLSKDFAYEGPEDTPDVVNGFVIPDFEYRTSKFYTFGVSIAYTIQMKKMAHFVCADIGRIAANNADKTGKQNTSRTVFSVKLGLCF